MTRNELVILQSLPLEIKIAKTKQRIREFVDRYGEDACYISFSGGKDSTVLLHIVRELYPNVEAVFVDTGLEYPEIKQFVKTIDNVTILRPRMSYKQVLEKYGYPVISKEQSRYIYDVRNSSSEKMRALRLSKDTKFRISDKWMYMLDAPFKISHMCCNVMKKNPFRRFHYNNERYALNGMIADESQTRRIKYLKTGCNNFNTSHPTSQPLGFWTENDILEYIYTYNVTIASVYGNVIQCDNKYSTTGVKRTGCIFCLYGCHMEQEPNRIQQLKVTHPPLYTYCLDKLGLKEIMEFMEIPYE